MRAYELLLLVLLLIVIVLGLAENHQRLMNDQKVVYGEDDDHHNQRSLMISPVVQRDGGDLLENSSGAPASDGGIDTGYDQAGGSGHHSTDLRKWNKQHPKPDHN
ncbi:hypothetical protein Scep_005028 [Stephania cephalantha]|uniref:Secreted protein n=1 Tax=Stephania cephalantha TaxID=152367 RepID=A0AAP0PXT7_9MAGN